MLNRCVHMHALSAVETEAAVGVRAMRLLQHGADMSHGLSVVCSIVNGCRSLAIHARVSKHQQLSSVHRQGW